MRTFESEPICYQGVKPNLYGYSYLKSLFYSEVKQNLNHTLSAQPVLKQNQKKYRFY